MTNCPNCGAPVAPGQRLCGECRYDLQSPAPSNVPAEDTASPYAYAQPMGYFDNQPLAEPPRAGRTIVIGIVFLLALCFAFACGILVGDQLPELLKALGFGKPAPVPTPRPGGWLPILLQWIA